MDKVTLKCEHCDKEYSQFHCVVNRHKEKKNFCSLECYYKSKKHDDVICKQCGKSFTPHSKNKQTYCSRECSAKSPKPTKFPQLTKEFLSLKVKNNITMKQIADEVGCSAGYVHDKCREFNIEIKNITEATILNPDDVFENWTVVRRLENKYNKTYYWCRCKCMREARVQGSSLKNGDSTGCSKCCKKKGNKSSRWKGYEEISAKILKGIIRGADNRNLEYSVSNEYIWSLYIKQNRRCSLTGLQLTFGSKEQDTTASLDRIDSKKGYVEGNLQWVHKEINILKWAHPQEKFIEWCQWVANHQAKETTIIQSQLYGTILKAPVEVDAVLTAQE